MPKKSTKKQNSKNIFQKIYFKVSDFFKRKPLMAYIFLTLILMTGVFFMEKSAQWFKASILEAPIVPFEGTDMPIKKVPNWAKTGGQNTKNYSEYASADLIDMPKYSISQLQSDKTDNDTVNAKITYSVVYMGNYKLDHTENVGSHLAVDIRIPTGTPVYAVANGIVEKIETKNSGFGKYIVIQHPNVPTDYGHDTLYSSYSHLSEISVNTGETVKKGQLIGKSGSSGTSTTPHLHFQIDRSTAPWHPWWPFTSAQSAQAGLSFFESINTGLGKEEALKNTINPMTWVQKHLNTSINSTNNNSVVNNKDDTPIVNLADFEITADKEEYLVGEKASITIKALDSNGKVITNYSGENLKISSTDKEIIIPNPIFSNGQSKIDITLKNTGNISIILRQERITKILQIIIKETQSNEHASPNENNNQVDNTTNESNNTSENTSDNTEISKTSASEFKIEGETFMRAEEKILLTIKALDSSGNKINNLSLNTPLQIAVNGNGKASPQVLNENDFKNGEATISFAGNGEGTNNITIAGYPNSKLTIRVLEETLPVVSFRIEHDGNFVQGVAKEITISTMDEYGDITPRSFSGTADLSLVSGSGYFSKNSLAPTDFNNGVAKITFTPTSDDQIRLRIKSGVLVGNSDRISVIIAPAFTDVKTGDKYAEAILSLQKQGTISGYADGTFKPNQKIARVETLKMLLLALEIPVISGQLAFADTPANEWYAEYLYTGVKNNIVNGFADGTFKPGANINRAEFFKILLLTANVEFEENVIRDPFEDVSKDDWYAPYAKFARDNDLLDFSGKFYSDREITRGEVAEALYRLLSM